MSGHNRATTVAFRVEDRTTGDVNEPIKFDYLFLSPEVTALDSYPVGIPSDHRMLVNRIAFG